MLYRRSCSHGGTRTVVQNLYVIVPTDTEAPQDARSIEATATTTTMKKSKNATEYPDASKKGNLVRYLTILGIEHNETQTLKDLNKLLPKEWRTLLPEDWQSRFSPPSPGNRRGTQESSLNTSPTRTISEGIPESSSTGEASPENPGEDLESSAVHNPTGTPKEQTTARSTPTNSDPTTETDKEHGLRNLQGDADLVTNEHEDHDEPKADERLREMQGDEDFVTKQHRVGGKARKKIPSDTEDQSSDDEEHADNNRVKVTASNKSRREPIVTVDADNNEETIEDLEELQGDEDVVMQEKTSNDETDAENDEEESKVDDDEYVQPEEENIESSDDDKSSKAKDTSYMLKKDAALRQEIDKNCVELAKATKGQFYSMDHEDAELIIERNKEFWKLTHTMEERKAAKKLAKAAGEMIAARKVIADDMRMMELQEKQADNEFMEGYAQCKPRAFPSDEIHDRSGTVRLPAVTFFVHEDPEVSLICQPAVNHRKIAISTLQTHFLPAAIETSASNVSFEESVYIIPYELTEKKDEGVPIFSAYNITEDNELILPKCRKVYAKYPTVGCMRETLEFFGMKTLLKRYFDKKRYKDNDPLQSTDIFVDMMTDPIFSETVYPTSHPFATVQSLKTTSQDNGATVFRNIRNEIQQNTRLRFAVMDGQHRVGIAIHVLSGYKLTNAFDETIYEDENMESYTLHKNSKINGKPPMKFLLPTTHKIDDSFIEKCIQASMEIVDRKPKAQGNPWRKVIYDALDDGEERSTSKQNIFDDFTFANSIFDKPQKRGRERPLVSIETVTNSA